MALSIDHTDHPLFRMDDELNYAILSTPTGPIRDLLTRLNLQLMSLRSTIRGVHSDHSKD